MKIRRKLAGFLLGICVFSYVAAGCGEEESQPFFIRTPSTKEESTEDIQEETPEYRLEELNMEEETMILRSLSDDRQVRYSYGLTTSFRDKYGETCSSLRFTPGVIVTVGPVMASSAISWIQLSDQVWNYEDVSKYQMDTDRGILTIGDTKYRLTESTVVYSDSQQIALTDIGTDDVLSVIGKDKDILSIMVTTGHGYLQLVNTSLFDGSMICIGSRIFTIVSGDMTLEVPEGSYDITVANQGYGGTANFTVTRNATTVVDLDQMKGSGPKICQITFQTDVEGAAVYIDGTQVAVGQALDVTYGSHSLKVTATGYDTWQKTLVVNSPSAVISVDLTDEEDTAGSTTDETTTSTDGSTESSSTTGSSSTTTDSSTSSGSSSTTGSSSSSGSSSKTNSTDTTDAEVDYLTTLSNMLSELLD
jgi:hypothetical protein